MPPDSHALEIKVPAVTLGFWVIKILATTLGETGGDAVSMSLDLGYLVATLIFLLVFVACVIAQVRARKFHPFLYWATIICSTTVGTTLADFATRSLGIGYAGGSALLFALLLASLFAWYRAAGTVRVASIDNPRSEWFYWVTIMFSQTLGTALGDWTADTAGLGYLGAAAIFSGMLSITLALHCFSRASKTALFWAAFVLTRPLGAVLGDLLDKPIEKGGFAFSRPLASALLLGAMVLCVMVFPQRAASRAH